MIRSLRLAIALSVACLAAPALAQSYTVPTTTTVTPSLECLQQTQNDFKSAWQQTRGNPYYDSYEGTVKNGISDTLEGTFAFMAAARGCTYRKTAAPVTGPSYADGFKAGVAAAAARAASTPAP